MTIFHFDNRKNLILGNGGQHWFLLREHIIFYFQEFAKRTPRLKLLAQIQAYTKSPTPPLSHTRKSNCPPLYIFVFSGNFMLRFLPY